MQKIQKALVITAFGACCAVNANSEELTKTSLCLPSDANPDIVYDFVPTFRKYFGQNEAIVGLTNPACLYVNVHPSKLDTVSNLFNGFATESLSEAETAELTATLERFDEVIDTVYELDKNTAPQYYILISTLYPEIDAELTETGLSLKGKRSALESFASLVGI